MIGKSMFRLASFLAVAFAIISPRPGLWAEGKTIRVDPVWDGAALGAGAGSAILTHFATADSPEALPEVNASELWAIDAAGLFDYDEGLSLASTGVECAALALPAGLALLCDRDELFPAALTYVEALCLTYAAKDLLKLALPRARPYVYGAASLEGSQLEKALESFPSGHTALAFCSASVFAALALDLAPEAPGLPWMIAGAYGLALGEGILRVASGNHFPTDALAGAALGGGIGWLVAKAHIVPDLAGGDGSPQARLLARPSGLVVKIAY